MNKLCKDNIICCDDNCQRCANLVYAEFIEAKRKLLELQHTNDFDAVKVVHGHWKRKPHWCVVCSCCGKYTHDYDGEVELYNYCPNCGAKMDEEVSE